MVDVLVNQISNIMAVTTPDFPYFQFPHHLFSFFITKRRNRVLCPHKIKPLPKIKEGAED